MHKSTSSRSRKLGLIALTGSLVLIGGAAAALAAGVTPAQAANLVTQPDTQVAVFMVPLTLLLMVLLFEAVRFVRRGALPEAMSPVRPLRPPLSPRKRGQ